MTIPPRTFPESSASAEGYAPQCLDVGTNVFPPLPPTHLMANVPLDGIATITWTPPYVPAGGSPQTGDYIWKLVGGPGTIDGISIPVDAISVNLIGLSINIVYSFTLQATNSYGPSYPATVSFLANRVGLHYVTSFAPTSGMGGSSVTITGAGFLGASSVTIGGVGCTFVVNSDFSIVAQVASGAITGPIVVSSPAGISSSLDSFTVVPTPPVAVISSFTPVSGEPGSTIVITGTEFTGASFVGINGISVNTFLVDSSTQISAVVATGNTTGKLSVKTPSGTAISVGSFTVTPVAVTSFVPTSGGPGSTINIYGTGFTNAIGVFINGFPVTSFMIVSDIQINAVVDEADVTGNIRVTTPYGIADSAGVFTVTGIVPAITALTPLSGPAGTVLHVFGRHLLAATAVTLGGAAATYTVASDTDIEITITSSSVTGVVVVTTPAGTATSSDTFTKTTVNMGVPTITSFTPTSGKQGDRIIITGTGFTTASAVKLGGTNVSQFFVDSDSQISADLSYLNTTGNFQVTNTSGSVTSAGTFTIIPYVPVITSITPTSGPAGTSVDIRGSGFSGATLVKLNGVAVASFTVNPDGLDLFAVVAGGNTSGYFAITTPQGTGTSTDSFTVTALVTTPIISSFTPTSGRSGTVVTINGSGFSGATSVKIGGVDNGTWVVNSDIRITRTTRFGDPTGVISVVKPSGTGVSSGTFTRLSSPPIITSFSPTSGTYKTPVTLYGSGLNYDSLPALGAVKLNGVVVNGYQPQANGSMIVTLAPNNTTGHFSATDPDGTGTSTGIFTVTPINPLITSFSPASGPTGTVVTINGVRFTGVTKVAIDGASSVINFASFTVISDTKITATTAAANKYSGLIYVSSPDGVYESSTQFMVTGTDALPVITSFSPASGAPGVVVTITGTGLTGATAIKLNGADRGGWTIVSDTKITKTIQANDSTGVFAVVKASGTATSASSFSVLTSPPSITAFSPTSGPDGSSVVINGSAFTGATAVKLGGINVASFTVLSNIQIRAVTSTSDVTGKFSITTPGGTGTSAATFTVTVGVPTITSFSPTSGYALDSFTITGTRFTAASAVKINGINVHSYTVNSSTSITAVVSASNATGAVSVTTSEGTATSTTNFTVLTDSGGGL